MPHISHILTYSQHLTLTKSHYLSTDVADYRGSYWYWEIVATLRKLLLTSVLAVTYPGTYDQMCIGMVIVLVFWRLESYAMPFFYHQVCFAMFAGLGLSRHAA